MTDRLVDHFHLVRRCDRLRGDPVLVVGDVVLRRHEDGRWQVRHEGSYVRVVDVDDAWLDRYLAHCAFDSSAEIMRVVRDLPQSA